MKKQETPPKTLKQYRKAQKENRIYPKGADFEDFLTLAGSKPAPPEQSLWRAVIYQMVSDALSNSQKDEQRRWRKEALSWLTSHSRDFRIVSDYAGYDPIWLQEQLNTFLQTHQMNHPSAPSAINLRFQPTQHMTPPLQARHHSNQLEPQ